MIEERASGSKRSLRSGGSMGGSRSDQESYPRRFEGLKQAVDGARCGRGDRIMNKILMGDMEHRRRQAIERRDARSAGAIKTRSGSALTATFRINYSVSPPRCLDSNVMLNRALFFRGKEVSSQLYDLLLPFHREEFTPVRRDRGRRVITSFLSHHLNHNRRLQDLNALSKTRP